MNDAKEFYHYIDDILGGNKNFSKYNIITIIFEQTNRNAIYQKIVNKLINYYYSKHGENLQNILEKNVNKWIEYCEQNIIDGII
jgi:predicted RNA-binding protein with PIN domain